MNSSTMCRESLIDFSKYEVHKDGNIKSIRFGTFLSNNNAHPYITNEFRLIDGTSSSFQRHRVIWYFFNGDIPEGMQIDHWNGNKTDNRLDNLRCLTPYDNTHNENTYQNFLDVVRSEEHREKLSKASLGRKMTEERYNKCFPTMFKDGHETPLDVRKKIGDKNSKRVDQIDKITGEVLHSWKSTTDAAEQLNCNNGSICKCCNGGYFDKRRNKWINTTQHNGYMWKRPM